MTVLGTVTEDSLHFPFHRFQDSSERAYARHYRLHLFLTVTVLHRFCQDSHRNGRFIPKRQKIHLCCHTYFHGAGILTCFPFDKFQLGFTLGPTNPQSTIVAEEPLPFRWWSFSLHYCCYFRQDPYSCKVHSLLRRSFCPIRTPLYHFPFGIQDIGTKLSPVHFQGHQPR